MNTIGWVYADLYNWELALEYDRLAVEESRSYGEPEMIRNSGLNLGDALLATGDITTAAVVLEQVERECDAPGTWGGEWMKWRYIQHLNASLGELRVAQSRVEEATVYAERCIDAAERTESPRNVVKGLRVRTRSRLATGDVDAAAADIERALPLARDVANPPQLWKTLALLADVREAQGRSDDAAAARKDALAVVEAVAASLREPGLAETLLAAAEVRALG